MSTPEPGSLAASLLAWVKSFDAGRQAVGLGELNDAQALWAILQDVDAEYFSGDLPEPSIGPTSEWTRKWQNLKFLEKQLSMYYRDVCNGQDVAGASFVPDLKAIAADSATSELEKLIMSIIRAAMLSPESNERMGKRLMALGNEHAMAIAYEIRSMQDTDMPDSETASRAESIYQSEHDVSEKVKVNGSKDADGFFGDPLLEREEELLQAQATIEKLQASQAAAQRQLQELRQDKEHLQEAFDAYRSEINSKGRKVTGDDAMKKLQRQADSDRAYIDGLESQLESSKNAVDSYERQIQKLKNENEAAQKLRDDLQILRAENEDLSQKVKANENLKKKIQALQEQERINLSLREELKQNGERLEELDRLKQVQSSLEKEIIEKKGLIRNQEYQINELTTTRKHAEYDARVLQQKLEAARERQDRDHEALEELRNRLQERNGTDEVDLEPSIETTAKPQEQDTKTRDTSTKSNAEVKHMTDKIALLEQQLSASDARLKQASERHAALEERDRVYQTSVEAHQKAQKQLEEQEGVISALRRELEILARQPTPAAREAAPVIPPDVAALQRENQLMVTAWYDLSSRLQNNGVSLNRRRQEPKSWIGKQRALVGPSSGGNSSSVSAFLLLHAFSVGISWRKSVLQKHFLIPSLTETLNPYALMNAHRHSVDWDQSALRIWHQPGPRAHSTEATHAFASSTLRDSHSSPRNSYMSSNFNHSTIFNSSLPVTFSL
jgi:protein HOOK3